MAKAAGFTCDRPGCGTFAIHEGSDKSVPDGWHILFVNGDAKAESRKELCSDYCVAIFAIERYELSGRTFKRTNAVKGERQINYRRYTPDEKREIVRLAREEGKSAAEIAEAFDIPASSVHRILTSHAKADD